MTNIFWINLVTKKNEGLPFKLPIIVEPKPYSENVLGGYMFNGIKVYEDLIIEKKGYKHNSELEGESYVWTCKWC